MEAFSIIVDPMFALGTAVINERGEQIGPSGSVFLSYEGDRRPLSDRLAGFVLSQLTDTDWATLKNGQEITVS